MIWPSGRRFPHGAAHFEALARLYRPTDDERMAAEARQLASRGLTEPDISEALREPIGKVREWIAQAGER